MVIYGFPVSPVTGYRLFLVNNRPACTPLHIILNYHLIINVPLKLPIMSMYSYKLSNNVNVPHNDKSILHKTIKINLKKK
jgi:hypothetical protein